MHYDDESFEPDETCHTSWLEATHGPQPRPAWVITELAALDTDLGLLKTGKEADVCLVERAVPDSERVCVMAAKRYRSSEHRLFHRDAGYLEGRRMRRSRENRAMARRTEFGRDLIAQQWAAAEFSALGRLWQLSEETGGLTVLAGAMTFMCNHYAACPLRRLAHRSVTRAAAA